MVVGYCPLTTEHLSNSFWASKCSRSSPAPALHGGTFGSHQCRAGAEELYSSFGAKVAIQLLGNCSTDARRLLDQLVEHVPSSCIAVWGPKLLYNCSAPARPSCAQDCYTFARQLLGTGGAQRYRCVEQVQGSSSIMPKPQT